MDGTRKRTSQRIHVDPDEGSEVGPQGCDVQGGRGGEELRREVDPGCNSVTALAEVDLAAALRHAANLWEANRDADWLQRELIAILRQVVAR